MKRKKFLEEIKGKAATELSKMAAERKTNLRALRFDLISGKVKNVKSIHSTRKEIARLKTLINKTNE